jgi:peptide-methionine (S)-S-oxide reductase
MNTTMSKVIAAVVVIAGIGALSARGLGANLRARTVAVPAPPRSEVLAVSPTEETAVFAGGCFWGIEAVFEHVKGVKNVVSGYAGGTTDNPSYEDVSSGTTGHAEAVRVVYDASQVSYGQLLQVFFSVAHDPTQLNRQGPDHGTQYRSAIFYGNDEQQRLAQSYVAQLTKEKAFPKAIVTEIAPLRTFYLAEQYHQDYMVHHPDQLYIVINDAPKVEHLKRQFPALYRETKKS